MIFLQLWWTLMVLSGSSAAAAQLGEQQGSEKLRNFHEAVQDAREQLHEINSNYGDVQGAELYRHRRNNIDELLESFAKEGEKEAPQAEAEDELDEDKKLERAADDWFRDLNSGVARIVPEEAASKHSRAAACRSKVQHFSSDYGKMLEQTEIGKVKKKYKEIHDEKPPVSAVISQPYQAGNAAATQLDIKLKHVQQLLHNQEMLEQSRTDKQQQILKYSQDKGQLPEFGDNAVPDGIYEKTLARLQYGHVNPNNLSHEANYKLSKIEQDAAERSRSRMPVGQGLHKRSSSTGFNPMNEIKLKTSNRLMRKGMGPSLPSNALSDTLRAHYVDDLLMRREQNMKREQERQRQKLQDDEAAQDALMSPYETLGSLSSSSISSSESLSNSGPVSKASSGYGSGARSSSLDLLMDAPQSYDYRMPQYDQYHSLSQRTLPNIRDYVQANAKLNKLRDREQERERDRYKRQPEHLMELEDPVLNFEENESKLDQMEAEARPEAVKMEQPDLELRLSDSDPKLLQLDYKEESAALKPVVEVTESKLEEPATNKDEPEANISPENPFEDGKSQGSGQPQSDTVAKSEEQTLEGVSISDSKTLQEQSQPSQVKSQVTKNQLVGGKYKGDETKSKMNSDAVVRLLASSLAMRAQDRDKRNTKRWGWQRFQRIQDTNAKRRSRRSVDQAPPEQSQSQSDERSVAESDVKSEIQSGIKSEGEAKIKSDALSDVKPGEQSEPQSKTELSSIELTKRSAKLLDDFADHNGNRVRLGTLGNGLLTLDEEDGSEAEAEAFPYPRHPAKVMDSNSFSNSRYEVPMMCHRNNNLNYAQQQQMQQQQQQQQQQMMPQHQLLTHQQQQVQPCCSPAAQSILQAPVQCQQQPLQQRALQQQQQFQQMQQQSNNLKPNFNLTHFFNELAKLQKLPAQQQQPAQLQQQQLQQQQAQQQQQPISPDQSSQSKPLYSGHRYTGPFLNKVGKPAVTIDPCLTTTTTTASPEQTNSSTINPDCVPIIVAGVGDGNGTTAVPDNICSNPDGVKLKISLNGNICSDTRTKQLFGNGSFSVQPAQSPRLSEDAYYDMEDALVDEANEELDSEDRYARHSRRRLNKNKAKVDDNNTAKDQDKDKDKEIDNEKEKDKDKDKVKIKGKGKASMKDRKQQRGKIHRAKISKMDKKKQAKQTEKSKITSDIFRESMDSYDSYEDNFDKLITGRASEEIVRTVFDMLGNDPSMDPLLSVLARNRKMAIKSPKNFYQLRNDRNEVHLQQTEEMVRKTIESISDIIDKQMRQRSCLPLRPDLVEFYDVIVKTMTEQQKCREKRELSLRMLSDDYNQDMRTLDANNIEQKSRIVKKLLRQYEELPIEEQSNVASIRDELLMDLIYLRKMADTLERSQRNAQLQGILKRASAVEPADQQNSNDYSPRFLKLLKTAEIFKEVGEQQAKDYIGL